MIVRKCNNNDNEIYINELINKQNFKNILELKMVWKDVLSVINLTIKTIDRLDPL